MTGHSGGIHRHSGKTGRSRLVRASPAADTVIGALIPEVLAPRSDEVPPLPIAELQFLLRDGSIQYEISRVDSSGRVSVRSLVYALGWHAGERLSLRASSTAMVLRPTDRGASHVAKHCSVVIPATARYLCGLGSGDGVLVAAVLNHGALVIHPLSVLDNMMARYHTAFTQPGDHYGR